MKPLGALRFDMRREVRNSGEPHIDLDHRLAPARSRSWLGLSIGAPFLNARGFPQQEVFEDEPIFASGKMSSARETRHLLTRHLWSGFDFDDLVKGGAVRARKGFEQRRSASSHVALAYPILAC
jgi:hypothetical protein